MTGFRNILRNILVGQDRFSNPTVVLRNAMLSGSIAVLAFMAGLVHVITDFLGEYSGDEGRYFLLMFFAAIVFWFNRTQQYNWAAVLLIMMGNVTIYLFAAGRDPASGVFFFFLITGAASLLLFGYPHRSTAFMLVISTYVIALLAYSASFYQGLTTGADFMVSFTVAYVIIVFIMYLSMQRSYNIENKLRESEQAAAQTAHELQYVRERFDMTIEGARAGIYEWDRHTDAVHAGVYYKVMLEYDDHELHDFTWDRYIALVHPDDVTVIKKVMEEHVVSKKPYQAEVRIRTKTGNYKWFSDSGISLFDEEGNALLTVGSLIDINERKMAEHQIRLQNDLLAQANDELDRFVYSASHDLRAPLNSMLGLIAIAEKAGSRAEAMQCLGMMKNRIEKMEGFIREIIDFSRNSKLNIEYRPTNIHKLVVESIDNLRFSSGAENIRMELEIDPDLEFSTDANRLKVVVNNLVANAIKYHDLRKARPFIRIAAFTDGHCHVLSIEDNGRGIPAEHKDKIFNMFYRASDDSEGSGLGLYIVKETLGKLFGDIRVKSVQGEGSTFVIQLPILA